MCLNKWSQLCQFVDAVFFNKQTIMLENTNVKQIQNKKVIERQKKERTQIQSIYIRDMSKDIIQ